MVRSAASLISAQGMSATSFADVISDSGAPRGSIYHHFPNGKDQLAEDAIRWTSDRVLAHLRDGDATTPTDVLNRFIDLWRQVVVTSGGASGCVVAGVAIDSGAGGLIEVVRDAFRSWIDLLTEQLHDVGVPAVRARKVAISTLAGMEGALILCRAEGGVGALDVVAEQIRGLVR
ncbi:MAG: hypothetical protein QOE52_506 [Mycobacterium sp.]|nr:hypothetical protein [Mycobacterium sp.]